MLIDGIAVSLDPRGDGNVISAKVWVLTAICSKHFSGGGNIYLPAETLILSKYFKYNQSKEWLDLPGVEC